jgi:hypothetical protein
VTSKNRRWLTAAVATVGAGALTFGGAVLPAAAESSDQISTLTAGANKYEVAAGFTGSTVEEIKALEESGAIEVSTNGFVKHIDAAAEKAPSPSTQRIAPLGAPIPSDPATGSRPGAPVTIYLDFDGETLTNTAWNADEGVASLDFAGSPGAAAASAQVWAGVAEDFAPFNINVTTTRPSDDKLYKTSIDDNEYGVHVIVTDSYDEVLGSALNTSGLAWGSGAGSDYLTGALVFTEGLGGAAATGKSIGDTASHEAAHNLGLIHDGIAGSPSGEYYVPDTGIWGPIMGATFYVPLSQWSNGGYAGATNTEDDLSVITNRSVKQQFFAYASLGGTPYYGDVCVPAGVDTDNLQPGDVLYAIGAGDSCNPPGPQLTLNFSFLDRADFAADDFGNDAASAHALPNTTGDFATPGVIGQPTDVDVFSVSAAAGPFTASVEVANIAPNLDAKLTLTDSAGTVLDTDDPAATRVSEDVASGLGASVSADVEGGVYYLTVEGVGFGTPNTATPINANGYTDYGSLGNYTVAGEAVPIAPVVIETPADGSPVTGGDDVDVTGTASPGSTVTLTVGGVAVATAVVDDEGNWTATVTANDYGNTVIVASQTVGDDVLPETDTVTVTAPVTAPVVTAPADGSTTDDSTPTLSGTGISGATVAITLTSASGGTIVTSATVNAEGVWTVDVAEAIGNGVYTVTATQSINGVTSDVSEEISFTVNAVITNPNADADANGTGTGTGNNTGELATTGGDFSSMLIVALVAAALVAGGGFAAFGLRRKKAALES